jgi:4-diphosphocytidyl-2-C-methyl-D-erythritol kinase
VSAGLAGGSADAAAVLFALNELSDAPLSLDELKAIGATLGADVPFCIECGSLLTKGIGEITSPFPAMPEYPIVIAKMGEGMSTPMAYKKLDEMHADFVGYKPHEEQLAMLEATGDTIEDYCLGIFNIFEQAVEPQRPDVPAIKKIMTENGAVNATMSGSGTSVFGIFKDSDSANHACELLRKMGAESYVCYPCTSHDRIIART